jgi:periplasmic divalent cation tolerance protein
MDSTNPTLVVNLTGNMSDFFQVTTSAGSRKEADRIAAELVERRLAGCVQIVGPVRSVYRWQGQVEQADEWLCLVKTSSDRYAAVEAAIRALHSYECPEIIATPFVAGSDAYLTWLAAQVDGD